MKDRDQEHADDVPTPTLDAEAVRQLGLARGFEWTLEEAAAIRDQLVSTHEGLRCAELRIDARGEEPASGFQPGWDA